MTKEKASESPLACNLGAMTVKQRERHRTLGRELREAIAEIRELPEGFEFLLPSKAWAMAAEFVALERLCCPFVRFRLDLKEEGGPCRLTLTGREGVKEFLRLELGLTARLPL